MKHIKMCSITSFSIEKNVTCNVESLETKSIHITHICRKSVCSILGSTHVPIISLFQILWFDDDDDDEQENFIVYKLHTGI